MYSLYKVIFIPKDKASIYSIEHSNVMSSVEFSA